PRAVPADGGHAPSAPPRPEAWPRPRGGPAGRNVVIVHLESTAARHLRPYGADVDPMPNLTRLTGQAILFENAYTTYPETIKSFFAAHCARYPALDTTPQMYEGVPGPSLAPLLAGRGDPHGPVHSGR